MTGEGESCRATVHDWKMVFRRGMHFLTQCTSLISLLSPGGQPIDVLDPAPEHDRRLMFRVPPTLNRLQE